jgi:hypothetical protein
MQVDVDSMGIEVHGLSLTRKTNDKPLPGLDILFVHGSRCNENASAWPTIDAPWRSAWTQRDNPYVCWPEDWLPQDLGDSIRALSVSYDDAALRIKGIPKQEIANVIAHELCEILFSRYNQTSCHFIIRNLSGCSSDPVAVVQCVCVSLFISLSSAEAVLLCCAGAIGV